MPNVLAASNVFVAPFESTIGPSDYPLPLLEAMATGKPVIATDVGGISEIITNNDSGLLIEPNNSMQLAAAISTVLQNEDLSTKFGHHALSFVQKKFSVDEVVKKTESVYKAVLEA